MGRVDRLGIRVIHVANVDIRLVHRLFHAQVGHVDAARGVDGDTVRTRRDMSERLYRHPEVRNIGTYAGVAAPFSFSGATTTGTIAS